MKGICPGCGEEKDLHSIIRTRDNFDLIEVCEDCGEFLNNPTKGISLVVFNHPLEQIGDAA